MRFGKLSIDRLDLSLDLDLRVQDDSKARMISRMIKHLASRGMKVPRYMSDDQIIAYYEEWKDE